MQIKWTDKTVPITALTPYERNPRTITKKQFAQLKESVVALGQFATIPVTHDMRLVGGHQRLRVFQELGYSEIRVSIPDRELTDEEFKRVLIQSNHHNGMFDTDELVNAFDTDALIKWGLPEEMFVGARAPAKKKEKLCPHCHKDINEEPAA